MKSSALILFLTAGSLLATDPTVFTNSLGMKFVPVPGTQVLMCIHETRNADYAAYAVARGVHGAGAGTWEDSLKRLRVPEETANKDRRQVTYVDYKDAEGAAVG